MVALTISHGLSGFGPRNVQYVVHLALLLLSLQDRLADARKKGIDFKFHITVFEQQSNPESGFGPAFQTDCDAAVNTGAPGLPDIDLDNVDPAFVALTDHAQNLATRLEGNRTIILARLRVRNPAAAVLFEKAFPLNGRANTSIACITRGLWGLVLFENTRSAFDYILQKMQAIMFVVVYHGHKVTGVDFVTNPLKPRLLVNFGRATYREFDFVTLAHGTPLVPSVSPEVSAKAYSLTPNHDTLKAYLNAQGVLDAHGFILPGKFIAVTGVSLSAYDYATLLLPFLRGFELSPNDPAGFKFDPVVAAQYPGLITFISRNSQRGPAPPRLAPDHTWRGKTSLLSTKEMHALRLHRQSDWLSPSYKLLRANVAYSTGKVPSNVAPERNVQDYMQLYTTENDQYLRNGDSALGRSETALLRAGFVAFSMGSGLEANPTRAEELVLRKAPLTRKGRVGWSMFSSSGVEISSSERDNATFFKRWNHLHHFIAASPVVLQNAVALLFHNGIAIHKPASFNELGLTVATRKVALGTQEFDGLLAPKRMSRDGDKVFMSLKGRVKEIYNNNEHGWVPEYGKGMHFQTRNNKPISVFDAGMGGSGVNLPGGSVVGEQWNDTNSYDAAGTFATRHALLSIIIGFALVLTPGESPLDMVSALHDNAAPSINDFQSEVHRFRGTWREIQEKLVFVQVCEELANGNPAQFNAAIKQASTADLRNTFISKKSLTVRQNYTQRLQQIPPFNPHSFPSRFEKQFVGYTTPQLETMLDYLFEKIVMVLPDL